MSMPTLVDLEHGLEPGRLPRVRNCVLLFAICLAVGCDKRHEPSARQSASPVPVDVTPVDAKAASDHAVIVAFRYGLPDLKPLHELEDKIEQSINAAAAGEFDGNEIAANLSDGSLYMYGPDADRLFSAVQPALESAAFMRGAVVTLRYGRPDKATRERKVTVGATR